MPPRTRVLFGVLLPEQLCLTTSVHLPRSTALSRAEGPAALYAPGGGPVPHGTLPYGRQPVLLSVNKVVVFTAASWAPRGSGRRGGVASGSESRAVQLASSGRLAEASGRAAASPRGGDSRGQADTGGVPVGVRATGGIGTPTLYSELSHSHAFWLVWKLGRGWGAGGIACPELREKSPTSGCVGKEEIGQVGPVPHWALGNALHHYRFWAS